MTPTVHVECPICIIDYNQYMGVVDTGDQYRQYYNVCVKSQKSYKYLFWFVFEVLCFQCIYALPLFSMYIPTCISTYLSFKNN